MIDPGLFLAFVAAVTVLMLIPGPNVALIVATSVSHGTRRGLVAMAGTSTAMLAQLSVTALGLAEILGTLGAWFDALRWIGVAYLVTLGVAQWRAPSVDLTTVRPQATSSRAIFARGLLVSLTNPKTLFFYGAFFPQFVRADLAVAPQVLILSATFLALAILVDGAWALAAGRAKGVLAGRGRLRNRVSGGVLIGAGAALALARRR